MSVGDGVQRIEMVERETPVFGGAEFGAAGTYERPHGTVFGELDPTHHLNAGIVNLDRAPRNARGNVEYQSDFRILKPLDLERGNGCLVYDVPNRGNQPIMPRLNGAPDGGHPQHAGNGFLMRRGVNVHAFNQRTVAGILDMIRMLGAMVDAGGRAEELVGTLEADLVRARNRAKYLPMRPRVFFEEWDDPLISGIGWISELIEIARRHHIFADRRNHGAAKDRIVRMEEVVERAPDLVIGSWCGEKFRPERVAARPGFAQNPGCAEPWACRLD